tara:strand:- start:262 stop:441 length:180 start_codon:yes stop_codon:yes gene_type:complete
MFNNKILQLYRINRTKFFIKLSWYIGYKISLVPAVFKKEVLCTIERAALIFSGGIALDA